MYSPRCESLIIVEIATQQLQYRNSLYNANLENFIRLIVGTLIICLTYKGRSSQELPDDISECEPPDSIPNSEVKPLSADGSVGLPHVRVGHCQACYLKTLDSNDDRGFFFAYDFCHQRQSLIVDYGI